VLVAAVVAMTIAILAVLVVQDSSAGSVAIRWTQDLVMGTLADTESNTESGGTLDVARCSAPSPRVPVTGRRRAHLLTARSDRRGRRQDAM